MHAKPWSAAVGMLFVLAVATAWADGRIAESEVPKAAMDAVKTAVPEAKFISGHVDEDHHRTIYRLNVKAKDGGVLHVRVTADGKVTDLTPGLRLENSLTMDQVPQAAKDALAKFRPTAKVLEVTIGQHANQLAYQFDIAEGEIVERAYISEKGDVLKLEKKLFEHHAEGGHY